MTISASLSNPDYLPIQLAIEYPEGGRVPFLDGLAFDGTTFWVSSNATDHLYQISPSGSILMEVEAPNRYPFGLAFDGESLWLDDGTDQVYRLNLQGIPTGSFRIPANDLGGLTYGDSALWLTYWVNGTTLLRIDPPTSIDAGVAAVTDTLHIEGHARSGLAWDGEHILMPIIGVGRAHEIVRINLDGTVDERLPQAPAFRELVWADNRLWGFLGDAIVGYDLP
jgi:hypothetical protein